MDTNGQFLTGHRPRPPRLGVNVSVAVGEGVEVSVPLGVPVDVALPLPLGVDVGVLLGEADGVLVGDPLGVPLGDVVGLAVGVLVDVWLGLGVGLVVRVRVGLMVGDGVGLLVADALQTGRPRRQQWAPDRGPLREHNLRCRNSPPPRLPLPTSHQPVDGPRGNGRQARPRPPPPTRPDPHTRRRSRRWEYWQSTHWRPPAMPRVRTRWPTPTCSSSLSLGQGLLRRMAHIRGPTSHSPAGIRAMGTQ